MNNHDLPRELEEPISAFVETYNKKRLHERLNKLTPADVYFGRGPAIPEERERIKRLTFLNRRLQHQLNAALFNQQSDEPEPPPRNIKYVPNYLTTDSVACVRGFFPRRQVTNILLSMPGTEFNVSGPCSTFNLVQTKLGAQLNLTNQLILFSDFQGEFSKVSQSYSGKAGLKYWW